MTTPVHDAAHYHRRHSRSVIPIMADGSKKPALGKWGPYMKDRATTPEVDDWFRDGRHIAYAIVTGKVSDGLELLEIEGQFLDRMPELETLINQTGLDQLWARLQHGWVERSPSGGIHWIYRISDAPVPGNTKIARDLPTDHPLYDRPDEASRKDFETLLETRGEGGFFVAAPSHGSAHETGRPWEVLRGPEHIATLTIEERHTLVDTLKAMNRVPALAEQQHTLPLAPHDPTDGATPGDDFENKVDWADILTPAGWTYAGTRGRSRVWTRPGKRMGISASTGAAADRDRLYVFTSSTDFEPETPYTKLGAYAVLNTNGDHSEAARQLRRAGYGQEPAARLGLDSILSTPTSKDQPCTTTTSPTSDPASTSPSSTTNPTSTTTGGAPSPASPSTTSSTPAPSSGPSTPSAPTSSATAATPEPSSTSTSSATTPGSSPSGTGSGSIFSTTYTPSQHENTEPGTTPASSETGTEQPDPSPQPGQPWPTSSPEPSTWSDPSSTSSAPSSNASEQPSTPAGPTTAGGRPLRPLLHSEYGNALQLITHHGHRLRYCHDRGRWLAWNGHVWQWQAKGGGVAQQCAIDLAARMEEDSEAQKTWKKKSLSKANIAATLALAETDPRIAVSFDDLDSQPWDLNTPDGIIDLRTGKLGPSDPARLHTRSTAITPDYRADRTAWETFLRETFPGEDGMLDYLQVLFGYAAIGEVKEHVLPFAYGGGANGKSVLFETIGGVLGDYASTASSGFLMTSRHAQHPTSIAKLAGARVVFGSEVNEDDRFDEAKVKALTGGDSISARFMAQDEFEFTPTHTLFLAGNHQPAVESGGRSFWRRLRLIPFLHTVPDELQNPDLPALLQRQHGPAVLAWIAEGAARYAREGIVEPAGVRAATEDYRDAMDTVGRFLEERCEVYPGNDVFTTSVQVFRKDYEAWCYQEGEAPAKGRSLAGKLRAHGVMVGRDAPKGMRGTRLYGGLRLLSPGADEGAAQPELVGVG